MITIERNYPLLNHNTFGVQAKSTCFAEYYTADELKELLEQLHNAYPNKPLLQIGRGSNLLLVNDFDGVILHSCIRDLQITHEDTESVTLRVGSGMVWDNLVNHSVANGWWGLENLSAIPGEVGASAVQNIGAYGVEAKDCIVAVETVAVEDGNDRVFSCKECEYAYRQSIFKRELKGKYIVTYVSYRLSKVPTPRLTYGGLNKHLGKAPTLFEIRHCIQDIRAAKLPDTKVMGSAGSFFMNPVVPQETAGTLLAEYPDMPHYNAHEGHSKLSAGWLIEQCGWKGKSMGRAAVYSRQALVLVNLGGADGKEILSLARAVQGSVFDKFGIMLSMEVNIIGDER